VRRAVNVLIGNHGEDLQRTNSQSLTMALMELYGIGAADFLDYPERLQAITPEDVKKVARRLFSKDHLVIVQVG
jgi:predicted Zn-dependent peptidase